MTKATHTPGPWTYDRDSGEIIFDDADVCPLIATVSLESASPSQGEADGNLIAAAPDMLEALMELVRIGDLPVKISIRNAALDKARAALARAEGSQP